MSSSVRFFVLWNAMLLLDHHPPFPSESTSRIVEVTALPDEAVAATAHIVDDHLVFVALDEDAFRVGYMNREGISVLCPELAASPDLATSPTGFAYVTQSGNVCVVELQTKQVVKLPGPAKSVAISTDLAWAAVRDATGTSIWSIPTGSIVDRSSQVVLTITAGGQPHLTLSEAAEAIHASPLANGPFTLRGAMDLGTSSLAFFDSIHGTASVEKSSARLPVKCGG